MSETDFNVTPDEEVLVRSRDRESAEKVFKDVFGLDTSEPGHEMREVRREPEGIVYACKR